MCLREFRPSVALTVAPDQDTENQGFPPRGPRMSDEIKPTRTALAAAVAVALSGGAFDRTSVTIGPANGTAPGVALYVDEQPVSFGSRNLDYYAVDLERIAVLARPQGTLLGANSQPGTLRLITTKPQQEVFAAGFNARYSVTDGGSDSAAVDAYINIPLTDRMATRVVIYSDSQGGWIDPDRAVYTFCSKLNDRWCGAHSPIDSVNSPVSMSVRHATNNDQQIAGCRHDDLYRHEPARGRDRRNQPVPGLSELRSAAGIDGQNQLLPAAWSEPVCADAGRTAVA